MAVGEVRLDAGPPVVDDAPREARAAVPLTVGIAQSEQASCPALGLDAGALGGELLGGRVDQVAQHLPPDRRVTVEEPVHDLHGCDGRSRLRRTPPGRASTGLGSFLRWHSASREGVAVLWIIIFCGVGFVIVALHRAGQGLPPFLSSWKLVAVIAVVGSGVLAVLLLRQDDDQATSGEVAADNPASSASPVPHSTAASTRSIEPQETPEGSDSPTASPSRATSTAPRETPARSTSPPASPPPRIQTTTARYFGVPFETVQISGRYRGVQGSRALRVQVLRGGEWTQFPLPVVTEQSGAFDVVVLPGQGGRVSTTSRGSGAGQELAPPDSPAVVTRARGVARQV